MASRISAYVERVGHAGLPDIARVVASLSAFGGARCSNGRGVTN